MVLNTGFVFAILSALALVYGENATENIHPEPSPSSSSTLAPIIVTIPHADPTNTTTSAPTSSTSPSTTAHTTPASTTPTKTTSAPTTTPAPASTTVAPPGTGHYVVSKDNDTCIIADLAVQLSVEQDNKTVVLDMPQNASASGSCNNASQELQLSWTDDDVNNNSLRFVFGQNATTKRFALLRIDLTYAAGGAVLNVSRNHSEFSTPLSKSYRCEEPQEIRLAEDGSNTTFAVLTLSHVRLQAFHSEPNDKFGAAEDCASGSGPDVVPIAVGCALVGLVAIVLIAYLVGRRRSQARGYLSM